MIHIAPCSCELHVRIRELEASLSAEKASGKRRDESLNRMADEWATKAREMRARAEKAEEALKVYQDAEPIWRARVAELEAILQQGVRHAIEEREAD